MSPTAHDQVLTAIETAARQAGLPLDRLDDHIADELRIPPDLYAAYLLTWGAIESYRLAHPDLLDPPDAGGDERPSEYDPRPPGNDPRPVEAVELPLFDTCRVVGDLVALAAEVHDAAAVHRDLGRVVEISRRLAGAIGDLTELLADATAEGVVADA